MSKYIDANALAQKVVINGDVDFINKVTKLMIDAPSIEIIHCRECKRNADNGGLYDDGRTKCPIQEHYALLQDGFCHLGERSRR